MNKFHKQAYCIKLANIVKAARGILYNRYLRKKAANHILTVRSLYKQGATSTAVSQVTTTSPNGSAPKMSTSPSNTPNTVPNSAPPLVGPNSPEGRAQIEQINKQKMNPTIPKYKSTIQWNKNTGYNLGQPTTKDAFNAARAEYYNLQNYWKQLQGLNNPSLIAKNQAMYEQRMNQLREFGKAYNNYVSNFGGPIEAAKPFPKNIPQPPTTPSSPVFKYVWDKNTDGYVRQPNTTGVEDMSDLQALDWEEKDLARRFAEKTKGMTPEEASDWRATYEDQRSNIAYLRRQLQARQGAQ